MESRASFALGLDVGTNSLGWALIAVNEVGEPVHLTDCGVRIFQEAVEAKTRTPKNHARRTARLTRRILARRRRRKKKLLRLLIRHNLLPTSLGIEATIVERECNALGDPYALRKRGLDQALTPNEFGRVLMHLCSRRGFQSNRKSLFAALADDLDFQTWLDELDAEDEESSRSRKENQNDDEDIGKIKAEIAGLRAEMQAAGARTLGEFLADLPHGQRKRRRHTDRAMYKDEFERLWSKQAEFDTKLDDALRAEVHHCIFFQRPVVWRMSKACKKSGAGVCTLEPRRPRAKKARLDAQLFRLLQDINHIKVQDPVSREWRSLTAEQRKTLRDILHKQKSMTWGGVRKTLGIHRGECINLEDSKDKLAGNLTWIVLDDLLGERWSQMADAEREQLVEDLLTIEDKKALLRRLERHWKFERALRYRLATLELQPDTMSQSAKAIRQMLPFLEQGMIYSDARAKAGYGYEVKNEKPLSLLPVPPEVRNPVVQKSLYEVRRVVNAVIKAYGKPDLVTIELARDLKLNKKQKDALEKQNKANQKLNERAKEELKRLYGNDHPKRDDLIKYRLWEECKQVCPYTGKAIALETLFEPGRWDIEHILPYQRTLDDSYMNKTLCEAEFNRLHKRNRTPWEVLHERAADWEQVLQRIRDLPKPKRDRFERKDLDKVDDFISRQLNDTRYIAREAFAYMKRLGCDVSVTKGGMTADLRYHWGLNSLLSDSGEKERSDHRHHAVDAAVIALTTRQLYRGLASLSSKAGGKSLQQRLKVDEPWTGFRDELAKALDRIVISHAATRKLRDALHEDTAYGLRLYGPKREAKFVSRKPLDGDFKVSWVKDIADPKIAELVSKRLAEHGNDPKKAFADLDKAPLFHLDSKTLIKKVRLVDKFDPTSLVAVKDRAGKPYKHLRKGNYHHVEVVQEVISGRLDYRFVSMLEASRRARKERSPIVSSACEPGWQPLMSLSENDLVELRTELASPYYRVQKFGATRTNRNITFRHHLDATTGDSETGLTLRANSLKELLARKVTVDALGRLNPAND